MSFFDDLLSKLGFSDNGDDDHTRETFEDTEVDDEEEEDGDEEEGFRFGFKMPFFGRRDTGNDDEEDDEEDEDEEEAAPRASEQRSSAPRQGKVIDYGKSQKNAKQKQPPLREQHCERIVIVRQISDSRAIITHLHHGDSVFLNLENIDPKDCGRVIDLLSGAAFALGGSITKVSRLTYLLAPNSVEVVPPQAVHTAAGRYTL